MWILTLVFAFFLVTGFVFLYKIISRQNRIELQLESLERAMQEDTPQS